MSEHHEHKGSEKHQHQQQDDGPEYRSIQMRSSSPVNTLRMPVALHSTKIDVAASRHAPLHETQKWNLPQKISAIPEHYILGRTHTYISNTDAQVIANRIATSLSNESIAFQQNANHKNSLVAEAACGLKLSINLFQEADDVVVVEIQRRAGCSIVFRIAASSIVKAAQDRPRRSLHPPKFSIPKCIPKVCQEQRKKCMERDVERSLCLIRSEKKDTQLLGLQSLERLSKDHYGASILDNEKSVATLQQYLASPEPTCLMKRRALGILANVLEHSSPAKQCDAFKCHHFLESLLRSVQAAVASPHEAMQAARCLQNSSSSLSSRKHKSLYQWLMSTSTSHHAKLEEESYKLKCKLQS